MFPGQQLLVRDATDPDSYTALIGRKDAPSQLVSKPTAPAPRNLLGGGDALRSKKKTKASKKAPASFSEFFGQSAPGSSSLSRERGVAGPAPSEAADWEIVEPVEETLIEQVGPDRMVLRVIFVTVDRGMVEGILEGTEDTLQFIPSDCSLVEEYGESQFRLSLEVPDLLPPISQDDAPDFSAPLDCGPGHAGHSGRRNGSKKGGFLAPEDLEHNCAPQFLQIRAKLVFGIPATPGTVAVYWFAVMPQWIDKAYAFLEKVTVGAELFERVDSQTEHYQPALNTIDTTGLAVTEPEVPEQSEKLLHDSVLLKVAYVQFISTSLPVRNKDSNWELLYSTYNHGMSLSTMYRMLRAADPGPCVLVVRDSKGAVFGGFCTELWKNVKTTSTYYGGGESFVFRLHPTTAMFRWTGKNRYWQQSSSDAIQIGGGGGAPALWIDSALDRGSSSTTSTYDNECLATSTDFKINGLEVWGFEAPDF